MTELVLENLSVSLKGNLVVRDASLTVGAGELDQGLAITLDHLIAALEALGLADEVTRWLGSGGHLGDLCTGHWRQGDRGGDGSDGGEDDGGELGFHGRSLSVGILQRRLRPHRNGRAAGHLPITGIHAFG